MKEMGPCHTKECEEIVTMFTTVNYLMKFGIMASEGMEMKARSDRFTQESKKLMLGAKI